VTLTLAGEALHRHAQRILADVDQLAADLSDHASGIVGVVRLVANTSAVTQFLPADLAGFIAAHPGIRIEMDELNSREAVLGVVDGRADIAIFAEGTAALGLQTMPYRRDRLVLVVPSGHALAERAPDGPIAFVDAIEFDFVSLTEGTSLAQRMAAATEQLGRRLRVRIHVRSFDAMCQMVAAGLGIAVLPDAGGAAAPALDGASQDRPRRPVGRARAADRRARSRALPRPVRLLLDHFVARAQG
jgi:DNA-binding transcriptional LysR family regulator